MAGPWRSGGFEDRADLDGPRGGEAPGQFDGFRTVGHLDLREQFVRSGAALLSPAIRPVYRAVVIASQDDDALRERLYRQFLAVIEQRTLDRLTRAQRAGELVADADLTYPAEVLCGALYYRGLLSTRPVDEAAIDGLLDVFMAALRRLSVIPRDFR
ncbi:TetR-like C-terminal domain-containing protein [Streptomyces sp. NPDC102365]|uniref:TetR-like C-terminal domain-containing protein n=1 Tax=Streptomyces sp. NPDC102365 TaxID=3366162 RepID=UPI00382C7ABA